MGAIENFKPNTGESDEAFTKRKLAQETVIEALPDNLIDELETHLEYEKALSIKLDKPFDQIIKLKGELFEHLVESQYNKLLEIKGIDRESSVEISQLEHLLKKPDLVLFQRLGHFRRPDIIDIEEDSKEGSYRLRGMVEVKSGLLTYKSFQQLTEFDIDFKRFQKALSDLKENTDLLDDLDYDEIAGQIENIEKADDFEQTLYITSEKTRETLINRNLFRKGAIENNHSPKAALRRFNEFLDNITIKNSMFSSKDLEVLNEIVKERVTFPE